MDPGRVNIFCGVDDVGNVYNYTRGRYHQESHLNLQSKRLAGWNRSNERYLAAVQALAASGGSKGKAL